MQNAKFPVPRLGSSGAILGICDCLSISLGFCWPWEGREEHQTEPPLVVARTGGCVLLLAALFLTSCLLPCPLLWKTGRGGLPLTEVFNSKTTSAQESIFSLGQFSEESPLIQDKKKSLQMSVHSSSHEKNPKPKQPRAKWFLSFVTELRVTNPSLGCWWCPLPPRAS